MKRYYEEDLYEVPDEWPASPRSFLDDTIVELSEFPEGTQFYQIDSSDICTLFSADRPIAKNKYTSNVYFVAAWHMCLSDGLKKGLIDSFVIESGKPIFPLGYFKLSPNGYRYALLSRLTEHMPIHHPFINEVHDYLVQGKFDTAIREATVKLENRMHQISGAPLKAHGVKLIQILFKNAPGTKNTYEHHLRYSEVKFRRFFSYVRNEFAHKIHNPDMATTINLIARCAELYISLHALLGYPDDFSEET